MPRVTTRAQVEAVNVAVLDHWVMRDLKDMVLISMDERDLLARALGDLLVASGVATAVPMSGPELVMQAEQATMHHRALADGMANG